MSTDLDPTTQSRTKGLSRTKTRRTAVRAGLGGVLCAGLVVIAAAGPALADTTPSSAPSTGTAAHPCSADRLALVKDHVHEAVARRLVTIDQLTAVLAARPHTTDAHRSTLSALFASDTAGLKGVDAKVQGDTTCQAAVTDGKTVVTGYRVYLLLAPQTRLTTGADAGTYGAGRLAAVEPKAQAAIDALTDPTTKAKAQATLDDMTAKVTAAQADFAGVGDTVLGLVPADIPAKTGTVDAARGKVADGHAALAAALADAKALKQLLGAAAPTTS